MDDEIAKLHKAYMEAKILVWDNRLNLLSLEQFTGLAAIQIINEVSTSTNLMDPDVNNQLKPLVTLTNVEIQLLIEKYRDVLYAYM